MIIVTGGAGFIGSNLVAGLENIGAANITVCDTFGKDDKWRNIAKRELCDIVEPDNLFEYLSEYSDRIEAVFHMGAISSTTEQDVDLITQTNFVLSRQLWKWCAEQRVRLFYASSAATYGDGSNGFKDDESLLEMNKLRPLNAYGWSKHLFDRRILREYYSKKSTGNVDVPPQWAGLKFFNVYGPNEYHKGNQKSVICQLYPQIQAGSAAKLFKSHNSEYEDGGQLRDFIYVNDCVDVMLWLFDNPNINGIFNVGTGHARTFNDLAKSVFSALDKEPKINYVDMPIQIRDRYQYFTQADMNKLYEFGYDKTFTELEEGVKEYVSKYLSTEDPYR